MLTVDSLFDLSSFSHRLLFADCQYVWDALKKLKTFMDAQQYPRPGRGLPRQGEPLPHTLILHHGSILEASECEVEYGDATKGKLMVKKDGQLLAGASVLMAGTVFMGEGIIIGQGVLIESGAMIKSPTIIGDLTEVRQGAYLRGSCLTGRSCVVGHVTEVKHAVFLDEAKAGHFAYLGDSILGNRVNLGAGTKLANLRFTEGAVPVRTAEGRLDSGLRKFGAIIGDDVQTGCNSVTNPGTVLGKKSLVLPNTTVPSGYHVPGSIIR
jgi:acetyltransferase-like isoleucine patch superfamily enzyme